MTYQPTNWTAISIFILWLITAYILNEEHHNYLYIESCLNEAENENIRNLELIDSLNYEITKK